MHRSPENPESCASSGTVLRAFDIVLPTRLRTRLRSPLTSAASWVVASDYGELRHTMPRTCIAEDDVCV
jgi:hypothetical protein